MAVAAPAMHHKGPDRTAINRLGLWLFFFSESLIFALLLSSRFFLEGLNIPLKHGSDEQAVDQVLGLAITVILLLSSVTAFTGETAFEHGRKRLGHWMILATIVLGLIFAGGVAYEWKTAHFTRGEAFGTVFFTMTGVHASHVMSGVIMLGLVWVQALRGKYNEKNHWPVSGVVMYWHFVDVVWVFFYPALYLV
ncbi:MAG: heme-copper oxidase subunit III [Chloroflexi bacterium]|nr:heme-copper oxidase subunit III [Chloroflexota bacterium]